MRSWHRWGRAVAGKQVHRDGAAGLHGEDGAEGLPGDVNGDLAAGAQPLETSTRTCGGWGERGEREGEVHVERCTAEPKSAGGRVGETGWQAAAPSHPGSAIVRPQQKAPSHPGVAIVRPRAKAVLTVPCWVLPALQGYLNLLDREKAKPNRNLPATVSQESGGCVRWCASQSWEAPRGRIGRLRGTGKICLHQHQKGITMWPLEMKGPNTTSNSNQGHCVRWRCSGPAYVTDPWTCLLCCTCKLCVNAFCPHAGQAHVQVVHVHIE